jgi:hypothetical protein
MHGVGHWRRQVELTDLLSHIPRNQLARGLHVRNDPLGFVDPVHAGLTEACVRRNGAHGIHLRLDICRHELAVAPPAALYIDKVVGLTDATKALGDLLSLGADALALLARRLRFPFELLQAGSGLWGATRPPFCRRVARTLQLPLSALKPLLRLGGRLARRPRLGGHGAADRFDQLMLHMAEGRRVVHAKSMFNLRQQAWRFLAGRLNDLTVQTR